MKWKTYIWLITSILILPGVISWSKEYDYVDHESLPEMVHTLHQRMTYHEAPLSPNVVENKHDLLERELHELKEENAQFRIKLINQEKKLERLQRDHLDLQNTVQELLKHIRGYTEKSFTSSIHNMVEIRSELSASQIFASDVVRDLEVEKDPDTLVSGGDEMATGNRSILVSGNMTRSPRHVLEKRTQIFRRQAPQRQVVFHARLSAFDVHVVAGQAIVFDQVLTNIGGGYHVNSGMFIAPEDGIYAFHVTALSAFGKLIELVLVKNGSIVETVYADARGSLSFDSGSITVPVEVNKGDEVWVRVQTGDNVIHGNSYSTFTGWLITSNEKPTYISN